MLSYVNIHGRPVSVAPPSRSQEEGWLAAVLLALIVLSCSACSSAGAAQEPSASAVDIKRAAMSAWACPGMHAEWSGEVVVCLRERP